MANITLKNIVMNIKEELLNIVSIVIALSGTAAKFKIPAIEFNNIEHVLFLLFHFLITKWLLQSLIYVTVWIYFFIDFKIGGFNSEVEVKINDIVISKMQNKHYQDNHSLDLDIINLIPETQAIVQSYGNVKINKKRAKKYIEITAIKLGFAYDDGT